MTVSFNMTKVSIICDEKTLFEAEVCKITTLGFDCEVPLTCFADLRDETGRIQTFNFALSFFDEAAVVYGQLAVYSMRRITQTTGIITMRFKQLDQEMLALVNEFAATGKVVSLEQARREKKRRA